jgi:hypothetical protein
VGQSDLRAEGYDSIFNQRRLRFEARINTELQLRVYWVDNRLNAMTAVTSGSKSARG